MADRSILADRNAPFQGHIRQGGKNLGAGCAMLGEDHQAFGLGHDLRRLPDLRGAGIGGRGLHLGRAIQPFGGGRLAQNLSWQADMDWTEWSRSGDDPNAVGNLGHLFRKAQFIVPFAGLAYRRRLIAHLLAPSATPTEPAPFGGRCPAR